MLQFASFSFDVHMEELFGALTHGAALVLRTDDMLNSPATFWSKCREYGVTIASPPTAFWHELVTGFAANAEPPSCLRLLILGGERVSPERVIQWHRHVGTRSALVE